ncbi:hypothetical protein BCR43DRAFT_508505 [Syncephalastrum racemosum]|uniref:Uncharacterized protein n=1 Tax=Syncephalastrum racemosum TaxID=13706 RepID=A0A1X2H0R8_SYNRA|nr:hypothetical protein BCR43DRAFT_508505 [Syncephalastrum racemosum]
MSPNIVFFLDTPSYYTVGHDKDLLERPLAFHQEFSQRSVTDLHVRDNQSLQCHSIMRGAIDRAFRQAILVPAAAWEDVFILANYQRLQWKFSQMIYIRGDVGANHIRRLSLEKQVLEVGAERFQQMLFVNGAEGGYIFWTVQRSETHTLRTR